MSLVNCFIPPPSIQSLRVQPWPWIVHDIRAIRRPIAGIFAVFWSSSCECLTHTDTSYWLCRSSSLICLLTSVRVASPCSLSSSDVASPRGVYIRSSRSLFLSSSFHFNILCLAELRHCWSSIGPPTPSLHCCVVERTLCWLIFRNRLEGVALFLLFLAQPTLIIIT